MAKRLYDLAVKVGSYTDREGKEKNKYQNLGVILQGKDGPFLLMDRYFNPAGVPCDPEKGSIIVSMFKPRDEGFGSARDKADEEADVPF